MKWKKTDPKELSPSSAGYGKFSNLCIFKIIDPFYKTFNEERSIPIRFITFSKLQKI